MYSSLWEEDRRICTAGVVDINSFSHLKVRCFI